MHANPPPPRLFGREQFSELYDFQFDIQRFAEEVSVVKISGKVNNVEVGDTFTVNDAKYTVLSVETGSVTASVEGSNPATDLGNEIKISDTKSIGDGNTSITSSKLFTIDGLSTVDNLTLTDKVVAVGESALWTRAKDTITIDNGYKFSLVSSGGATTIANGTTTITKDGVYQFAEDFTGTLKISATNVKLIGASNTLTDVFIDASGVEGVNLWIKDLNVSTGNSGNNLIKFGSGTNYLTVEGENTLTNSASNSDNKQAVINSGSGTLNILGTGKLTAQLTGDISFGAAIGGDYEKTVGNINIGGSVQISATSNYGGAGIGSGGGSDASVGSITIGGTAQVTATSLYGAGIGSGAEGTVGTITIGGTAQVTATSLYGAAIGSGLQGTVNNITIGGTANVNASSSSGAAIGAGNFGSVSGTITYGTGATVNGEKGTETTLDNLDVNITAQSDPTGDSSSGGASVIYGTGGKEGWYLEDNIATFNLAGLSDYFTLESGEKQITYHEETLGTVQVELSGVTDVSDFSVSGTTANLSASGFGQSVEVISNGGSYAFNITGDGQSKGFLGLNDSADTITNAAEGLMFDGRGGDDILTNSGASAIVYGGVGDDIITNSGASALIYGEDGNDTISNTGDNAFISGGGGSNVINLNDGTNVTVNVSEGDDIINLDSGFTNGFTVVGFSAGDTITGSNLKLSDDGNSFLNGDNVISGLSVGSISTYWNEGTDNISYHSDTVAGGKLDNNSITWLEGSASTLFTIDGLSTSDNLTLTDKVVTVGESALWARAKDTITIDNDYTFSFGSGTVEATTLANGTTEITADGVYQFADDFTGTLTISATNVKLIGASKTLTDVFIDVTATNANLWIKDLKITTAQYATASSSTNRRLIRFAGGTNYLTVAGTNTLTNSADDSDNEQAVINSGTGTLNILGSGSLTAQLTGTSYGAAIGGDYDQTVGDINIGGSVQISATSNHSGAAIGSGCGGTVSDITIGSNATVAATATSGAGIGSGLNGKVSNINIGGKATVDATSTGGGAGIGSGRNGTAGDITVKDESKINASSHSTWTVDSTLTTVADNLTSTDPAGDSSSGGASVIYGVGGQSGWYLEDNIATFNLAGLSDYFTLESDNKVITYHEETLGTVQVELSGVTDVSDFSVSGTTANLSASGFGQSVEVISNGGSYAFNITGDGQSKGFLGLNDSADTITNAAEGLMFDGRGGDDILTNSGASAIVYGGVGDDIITNSGASALIYGEDGNDTITNTGNNVILNGGGGSNVINLNDGTNVTVNVSEGDDIINLDSGFTNGFTVVGFSAGDTITGSNLTESDGKFYNNGNEISGLSVGSISTYWNGGTDNISYHSDTVAGGKLDNNSITWLEGSASTLFTIDGLSTSDNLTVTDKVVAVGESALWARAKDTITIDNDYTFSFGSGTVETQTLANGTTEITADGVYQLAEDFTGTLTISATNVKLIGASNTLTDVFIDASGVEGVNLWIKDLNITTAQYATASSGTNYRLIRFGAGNNYLTVEGTNTLTNSASNIDNEQAVINSGAGTLNIIGTGNLTAQLTGNISYGAAIGGDYEKTVGNINIGGSVQISATSNYGGAGIGSGRNGTVSNINIGGNATVNAISNDGAGIGSGYSGTAGDITIGGTATVNATSKYGAGIGSSYYSKVNNITIGGTANVTASSSSGAAIGAGNFGSVSGTITYGTGATVNGNKGTTEGLDDLDVNITAQSDPAGDSSSGGASVIYGVGGQSGWYLEDNTATFNLAGLSDYFTLESGEKQITYHEETLGAVQVELSGITDVSDFSVSGTTANLSASGFGQSVEVISNGGSYAFNITGDGQSKGFLGLNDSADTITNAAEGLMFDGRGGDDILTNSGASAIVYGGVGDDIITNSGASAIVYGEDGNDTISNTGNNVILNGGGGSNVINLNDGTNVTVNVSEGDDLIKLDSGFTNGFTVVGFSAGDTITGSNLTESDGKFYNNGNEISGLSVGSISNYWNGGTDNISYHSDTVAGGKLDNNSITWLEGSASTLFTIDGLSTSDNLTVTDKVVTVGESALWTRAKDTITIDNDYTFSFGSGTVETQTLTNGTTTITKDGVYQFAEDFTGTLTISATNVKLIGASKTLTDVFIDASGVEGVNLWIKDLNITTAQYATASSGTNYRLIRFGAGNNYLTVEGTNTLTNSASNIDNKQAVINSGSGTLNILGTGKLTAQLTGYYSYGAAIGGDYEETVGNINIGGSVQISATSNYGGAGIGSGNYGTAGDITIGGTAQVTATSLYSAGIGSGAEGTVGTITIGGKAQVTATSIIGAGIGSGYYGTAGDITIGGTANVTATSNNGSAVGSGESGTLSGTITCGTGATLILNNSSEPMKGDTSGLDDLDVNITAQSDPAGDSSSGGASVIYGVGGQSGWYLEDNIATFNLGGASDYFTLESDNKVITYHEETLGTVQVELSGVSNLSTLGDPTTNNIVTLNADNFTAAGISIISNSAAYGFELTGGTAFYGSSAADTITVVSGAVNMTINGLAGDDIIRNSGASALIYGGSGNDSIINLTGGQNATISGGDGNDTITNNGANATIDGGDGADVINNSGEYAILDGGAGNDTIDNISDHVSINGGDGADQITNSGQDVTIDGGAGDDTITNTGANAILDGGTGADVITNSGVNSKIYGGAGDDTITNTSANVTINSGYDNDNITNSGVDALIEGGSGNDSISNSGTGATIDGGAGDDTITNTAGNAVILGGADKDLITNSGVGATIDGGAGDDTINNTADNAFINGGADKDLITNSGVGATIDGGAGDDTITNTAGNAFINGGADNDLITNSGASATIDGGAGDDTITNTAGNAVILGGADNDLIINDGDNVTVSGGDGNDFINFAGKDGIVMFSDGSDTINYSENYTIDFNGGTGYKTAVDGGDVLIYDANNTLRVIDAFGKQINVKNYNGVAESVISSGRNTAAMLTYNSKKTQVTLNGTAEATVSGKKLFVGKLNASDYSSTAVTLTAGEGANEGKPIYIEGNAKANFIQANSVGGTMNGGAGNDKLHGNIGADVFAYRIGQGRDSIWNYDGTMDKIQLLDFVEGETKFGYDVNSAGNIVMTVASNYITIVDPFTNADSTTVTIVGSNGTTELNVSGYTYTKNSIADPQGNVTLASAATAYTITANDKSIDATKVTGAVAIDATNLAKNLTVTGLGSNATIKGIALSAIATSEFASNNIALGLENGVLTLADVTTNTVQLDEGNFYVGANYLYQGNADEAQATGFTLTSGNTAGLDKSSSTAGLSIFGGFVINNIGLSGSSGDDFITTGLGDDTVYGGGGSDTFVFGGGKDTFFDYQFGEDVINAGDLDIDNGNYDSTTGFVTINQGGNSSISIFVDKNNPNPQITFTDGTNTTIKNYGQIGNFNEELTSVTLYSSVKFTDDNKAGFIAKKLADADSTYSKLSTIVADNVTSDEVATIKGLAGISSYISAGEKMLALIGGNMDDTLVSGGGSALFTGGTGADLFKPGTGEDVITDYNFAEGDLIELDEGYDIGSISRLDDNVDGEDGIKLIFDDEITTLGLSGLANTDAVQINGASYFFDPTDKYQKIFTGDNKGVTVLSSGNNITANADELKGAETVIIRDGGTITAAADGGKTIGGKNVTLTGADGADTFLYTGGDVLVDKYTSTADKLTLASGITILNSTVDTASNTVDITVTGGGKLQVKVEDESATSIVVNTSAGDQVIWINQKDNIFDRRNHPSANAVTVVGAYGDFGVLVDNPEEVVDQNVHEYESDKGPGEEYYSVLFSITAAQENSTLIGNSQSNYLIANSGTKNVLTGGIGKDYFIFNSGGGEIRDFGGGATKNSDKKVMAGETNQEADGTYLAYDRSDPTTYKESTDVLQVNGTVKAIAYTGKGDDTTAKTSNKFTAYVVYDQDGDDATTDDLFVIRLNNIYKQPIKFGTSLTYRTDDYVAERFKIWDTSTGKMAALDLAAGGANADLLTTVADSGYSEKIAELDNILPDQTSWTPGEYVYPTKDSGGLNGGFKSAAPSGNNDPSSNKQNNG